MKKIVIIMVLVIIVGVLSTSGCVGEWVDTILKGQNFVYPQKNNQNEQTNSTKISLEDAKKLALAHVKKRMAEGSAELSNQVDERWLQDPKISREEFSFPVHAPGVGAHVPDFYVYVDVKTGEVDDNLSKFWVQDTKSDFD
jgi:hypothetical protein